MNGQRMYCRYHPLKSINKHAHVSVCTHVGTYSKLTRGDLAALMKCSETLM